MRQTNGCIEELDIEITPQEKAAYLLMYAKWKNGQASDNVIDINFGGAGDIMRKSWVTNVRCDVFAEVYGSPHDTIRHGNYVMHIWNDQCDEDKQLFRTVFKDYQMMMID